MFAIAVIIYLFLVSFSFHLYGSEENFLGLSLINRVLKGIDTPAIIIKPQKNLEFLKLKIKRDDGFEKKFEIKNIEKGNEKKFIWQQSEGKLQYKAFFTLKFVGEKQKDFAISFEVLCKKPFEIKISKQTVDLEKKSISFSIPEKAARAELLVYGAENKIVSQKEFKFNAEPPFKNLTVRWEEESDVITLIKLRVWDTDDFYAGVEITPFFVEIPHREVLFDFGKWEIKKQEEEKLDETLMEIKKAIKKYGNELEIKLYIAGYTDTVDTKEFNKELSEKRAREIGKYLRKKGLKIPIFYQGFGEEVLAIPTPDETTEVRNRRAIYILANQPPPYSSAIPKREWKKL